MTTKTTSRVHLHRDDYPQTLRLLEDLRNGRPAEEWKHIGYERTESGAWVDWDELAGSWLSTTEKAVVHIARGASMLERAGGPPPRLAPTVTNVIAGICQPATSNAWMGAVFGGIDTHRIDEHDPDLALALHELDDSATDLLLLVGSTDDTPSARAELAHKMRRQLTFLTADLSDRVEEWCS